MIVILYKSKHGSTAKIGKVINAYIGNCTLMNYQEIDYDVLSSCDTIVLGIPVYYGKLDMEMVKFVKDNQELLISKNYSIYVTALFYTEFMHYITSEFDYGILRNVKAIAGLGGALYYPQLSIQEKMVLTVMNRRSPVIPKEHNDTLFENFNNEEIEIFANKIKKIDENAKAAS